MVVGHTVGTFRAPGPGLSPRDFNPEWHTMSQWYPEYIQTW